MARPGPVPDARLSRAAAQAVRAGHPWVLKEERLPWPAGTVVRLVDGRSGERLGTGLVDDGPIAIRVLSRRAPEPLPALVRRRIADGDALRRALFGGTDTDCWRVVNGAGDGLDGLVVDRYGRALVLKVYASAWLAHLEAVLDAVRGLPDSDGVLRRFGVERVDGRSGAEVLHGEVPEVVEVREHGMRLLVRPWVGQKTGMFLDQREHRALVRQWSRERSVANLFAYHGGFSVAAALGGARRVVSVDLAPEAMADARDNFRRNGIDPDRHGFEVADAFAWTPSAPLDLLVLDPPSLARDQRAVPAARAAYARLHRHHGAAVGPGGLLATSSCTARIAAADWRTVVRESLPGTEWSWHHASVEPIDHPVALGHPEGAYLKFALLRRRA